MMGEYTVDLKFGQANKLYFGNLLKRVPGTTSVTPIPDGWKKGTDLRWEYDGEEKKVLVRSEKRYSGNIFLETMSNSLTRKPGWYFTSKADYLAYGFIPQRNDGKNRQNHPTQPLWFIFSFDNLRRYVAQMNLTYSRPETERVNAKGVKFSPYNYRSEGLLLDINSVSILMPGGPKIPGPMTMALIMFDEHFGVWYDAQCTT